MYYFNPRSHEGSDTQKDLCNRYVNYFNPRSHEGSDGTLPFRILSVSYFNPRSHEGSDQHAYEINDFYLYFNPRSHEGSDLLHLRCMFRLIFISIHAPTRGATVLPEDVFDCIAISIHAPTRGATRRRWIYHTCQKDFNPRSHEGSDMGNLYL